MTLKVGSVPYLVGRPLDEGLEREPGIELVRAVPARLVEGLRDGSIDVALVSSIELFRREGYRYLDGCAVAGRGFVASVCVFLRKPIEEVRSIALDPASRTAATLVQVLLAGRDVEFIEVPDGEDPRSITADAWLRIGDTALRECIEEGLPVFNPSEVWAERTGLPFVFAPWIVRPGVEIEPFVGAFVRARTHGMTRLGSLANEASRSWQLPEDACFRYLSEECLYDPGDETTPALLAFRDAAAPLGLCDGALTPGAIELSGAHA